MTQNDSNKNSESQVQQDIRKSKVRVCVTYLMSLTYAVASLGLIASLMWLEKYDLTLGVFSGVASTTAAIFSFWFGSRGASSKSNSQ